MTRNEEVTGLIYKEESYAIIGACMVAYKEHRAQVLNYLSATGCKLGLLVNFGHYPKLQYERLHRDTRNPSIFGSKTFCVFRVFRGQINL